MRLTLERTSKNVVMRYFLPPNTIRNANDPQKKSVDIMSEEAPKRYLIVFFFVRENIWFELALCQIEWYNGHGNSLILNRMASV